MTTRVLLLPAVIAGLFIIAGCFGTIEPPKADELPQAPAPRERAEKTKAELLVGTWKLVKQTTHGLWDPQLTLTFEYRPDGTVTLWRDGPVDGSSLQRGTYRVEGNTLHRTMNADPRQQDVTIDSITDDKLVTSWSDGGQLFISEYRRVGDEH